MLTPVFDAPKHVDIAERVGDPRLPLAPHVARHLGVKLTPQEIERAEDDIDYLGIMRDPEARTDADIFDAAIGSLGVLGYGRAWLACAFGVDERHLQPGQRQVKPYAMHLALAAAIRIGSRWATPESTGQTAQQIEDVQRQALRLGFGVPAAYSNRYAREVKTVLPRSSDRALSVSAEERIIAKIQMLAYFCANGGAEVALARRFGLSSRTIGRTRRDEIGLDVVADGNQHTSAAPGQDDLVAAIYRAANSLSVEEPHLVYKRLHAFAAGRKARLAAEQAARAAEIAAAAA